MFDTTWNELSDSCLIEKLPFPYNNVYMFIFC